MQISGASALVTGGASGLGLATAAALAARGARVVILDLERSNGAAAAAHLGDAVRFAAGDVTSEDDVQRAVDLASDGAGGLRIVVNCAGIGIPRRIVGRDGVLPLAEFKHVLEVNLVGTFNVIRLAAARMISTAPVGEERGVIVNTASVAAFDGQIGQASYTASKAGIVGLNLVVARELASKLIRCVTIAPGIMDTPILGGLTAAARASLEVSVPHPSRLGRPEEFAALVTHIVENPYLNGETIRLDAGIRMAPR